VSKSAAAVLAFAGFILFSLPMSAQLNGLLPSGNVYGGVSYAQLTNVTNTQSYKGFEGSAEDMLFSRFQHFGVVVDASGYFRKGEKEYDFLGGFRLSSNYGKWRPFAHAMAGIRHLDSSGFVYNPILIDVGGGVDYKILKSFSWRFQGDYRHSRFVSATQNDYRASTGIVWRF